MNEYDLQRIREFKHLDHNLPGKLVLDEHGRPTRGVPDPFTPERCRLWWKRADLYMILFAVLCGITVVALQYWGLRIK